MTGLGHVVFAVPVVGMLVPFRLLSLDGALILIAFFSVIGIPLSAGIIYLIAKGSSSGLEMNNRMRSVLMITSGLLPGQMYGVFFGGMLGYHFDDRDGGVIGAIVFFIGRLAGERVAQYLCNNRL